MAVKKQSISIFFPFLNDWGTVGSLIGLSISTVSKLTDDWEIIIINDGSLPENSAALEAVTKVFNLAFKSKVNPPAGGQKSKIQIKNQNFLDKIRIIHHEKNKGYGGALRSGINACTKDLIFYTDCDAQYDPREMALLYEKMKASSLAKASADKVGLVNGYKIKRNDPWIRVVAGRVYHYAVRFAFGLPIKDTDCDFRLMRREVFDPSAGSGRTRVRLFENTGTICVELVKKIDRAGYKIEEVPVHHFWRTSGKSQFFNFKRLYATGSNLVKLWWKLVIIGNYSS